MSRPKFDVGNLRHRLTYETPLAIDREPSPSGVPPQDSEETWIPQATYWASVTPQTVRRTAGVDVPKNALWYEVTMRNPGASATITTAGRFRFLGSRILVIDSVQRVEERNAYLLLECTENVA